MQGATAQPVWKTKEIKAHFSTPVLVDGHIYGIGDGFGLACVDPKTGNATWKHADTERGNGWDKAGLVFVDGVLLAVNGADGDVFMVEAKPDAYHELGRFKPLGDQSWTTPAVSDGKLIIRNKTTLGCFDLK